MKMALVRWEPFQDLLAIQERMNRLFDETLQRTRSREEEDISAGLWAPPVDIYETENEIVLKAELPEIDQKDIEIKVEDNTLTIRGERRFDQETKKENYHRIERAYGKFSRSFSLPNTIDQEKIKASYKDGILKLVMPKKEEKKPKQITVEVK
jgi:HSP20 family protein